MCAGTSCHQGRKPCATPLRCSGVGAEYESTVSFMRDRIPSMPAPLAPKVEERDIEPDSGPCSWESFAEWVDGIPTLWMVLAIVALFFIVLPMAAGYLLAHTGR